MAGTVIVKVFTILHPIHEEVVEGAVRHELQCAERVGYALEVVALSVCEVVHGVGLPCSTCTVVGVVHYAIDDGVTEVHVGRCHVNLGAQHHASLLNLAAVHLLEELEALLHGAVAVGALGTRLCGGTLLCGDFLGRLLIDVGLALLDEVHGKVPQLLEVVRSVVLVTPLETEPLDILLDSLYILHILLRRVGIIETEVTYTAIFSCYTKVQADSLGVTDVQVAVWLWWETGLNACFTLCNGLLDDLLHKVKTLLGLNCFDVIILCHNLLCFIIVSSVMKSR